MISCQTIREKFIDFFKKRGHALLPPAPLVPQNDPTVLFTTAGMQQFKSWFVNPTFAKHKRAVTIQPCFRTSDIDEVGDATHLTYFEMLGHFSFGDYFKKESIHWAWEFITDWLKIDKDRVTATYFGGENNLSADADSIKILQEVLREDRIQAAGKADNFWGPTGAEGPCGPTVEFHVDGVEIWNSVFNEYYYKNGKYAKLKIPGVDMGGGLERIAQAVNGCENVFDADELKSLIKQIGPGEVRSRRIIADHIRAINGLAKDGILPSNKAQGAVLRRLIRRAFTHGRLIGAPDDLLKKLSDRQTRAAVSDELEKFVKTLKKAVPVYLRILEKTRAANRREISAHDGFLLQESYGLPIELTRELARKDGFTIEGAGFEKLVSDHQEKSRAGIEKKFRGGLVEITTETTRLHTAHHLLLAALRRQLGKHVVQRGSNITSERLRLDFSHPKSLSDDEISRVERLVNDWIGKNLKVKRKAMMLEEAYQQGALGEFGAVYPKKISVYSIIDDQNRIISCEICGGPHVAKTSEIKKTFKIIKEESSGTGVRRIKGVLA